MSAIVETVLSRETVRSLKLKVGRLREKEIMIEKQSKEIIKNCPHHCNLAPPNKLPFPCEWSMTSLACSVSMNQRTIF